MTTPDRFPMVFSDRVNAAAAVVYVPEIHWVLDFKSPLDKPRLKRAFRLLLDAEPILGCRLVSRPIRPYWNRMPAESLNAAELIVEVNGLSADLTKTEQTFFGDFLDGAAGPQIRGLLLSSADKDRLVIKINHCTCDAGGFKEVLYTLADIYRNLGKNPDYMPEPRVGSRSLGQVYNRFRLSRLLGIYVQGIREVLRMMRPFKSLQYPSVNSEEGELRYIFRHISSERVAQIMGFAGKHGATLNDVLVTAMLRALAKQTGWNGKCALRLVGTVDLRRYLPGRRAAALCQITGMSAVHLKNDLGETFEETLTRVKTQMDEQKKGYIGLGLFLIMKLGYLPFPYFLFKPAMAAFWQIGLADGNLPPGFTNLGPVDSHAADFGSPGLESAYLAIPATHPPWFGVGCSGFAGALTLSAGIWPSAVPPEKVEALFAMVEDELPVR